jgi:hypothetical protein
MKSNQKQKPVLPERYTLKKFHEHEFRLASYLDIESGIQVINNFLVMSPYCIDDEQCLFIFNDCDLRALKYGTNSTVLLAKRKSNNSNAVTNSKRYLLRIPKAILKQDLN